MNVALNCYFINKNYLNVLWLKEFLIYGFYDQKMYFVFKRSLKIITDRQKLKGLTFVNETIVFQQIENDPFLPVYASEARRYT